MASPEQPRSVRAIGLRKWPAGFNRLSEAQSFAPAGDALVAVSLAGSLFFSISPDASREQVLIYLLVNMVPFTLLAPFVGPVVDRVRGAHRVLLVVLYLSRAALVIGLALALFDLAFYFFALALVIVGKATGITKQALVPALVSAEEDLVAANARLARLSLIAGAIAGGAGAGLAAAFGPRSTLIAACGCFVVAAFIATRLPDLRPAPEDTGAAGPEAEPALDAPRSPLLRESAWAFTVIRAAVGFFSFGIAFALRRESEPAYMYGVAGAAWAAGTFGGNAIAPKLRARVTEDRLIAGSLISLAVVASFAALGASRPLVALVAAVLGLAASLARQGFDALVQARAPQAHRGRAFAGFETRFQLGWVVGAIAATAVGFPIQMSMAVVAAAMIPAGLFYLQRTTMLRQVIDRQVTEPLHAVNRRVEAVAQLVDISGAEPFGHPRVVAIEIAAAVDIAVAEGFAPSPELRATAARLRQLAVDGATPDHDEIITAARQLQAESALFDDQLTSLSRQEAPPTTTP